MKKKQLREEIEEILGLQKHKTIPCPANPKFTHLVKKTKDKAICGQCGQMCNVLSDMSKEKQLDALLQLFKEETLRIIGDMEKLHSDYDYAETDDLMNYNEGYYECKRDILEMLRQEMRKL